VVTAELVEGWDDDSGSPSWVSHWFSRADVRWQALEFAGVHLCRRINELTTRLGQLTARQQGWADSKKSSSVTRALMWPGALADMRDEERW
jgi:hypothetical protein